MAPDLVRSADKDEDIMIDEPLDSLEVDVEFSENIEVDESVEVEEGEEDLSQIPCGTPQWRGGSQRGPDGRVGQCADARSV